MEVLTLEMGKIADISLQVLSRYSSFLSHIEKDPIGNTEGFSRYFGAFFPHRLLLLLLGAKM